MTVTIFRFYFFHPYSNPFNRNILPVTCFNRLPTTWSISKKKDSDSIFQWRHMCSHIWFIDVIQQNFSTLEILIQDLPHLMHPLSAPWTRPEPILSNKNQEQLVRKIFFHGTCRLQVVAPRSYRRAVVRLGCKRFDSWKTPFLWFTP